MNELATKWVEALRSGEYKQGQNILNDRGVQFCCLGVLCEIAGLPKTPEGHYKINGQWRKHAISQMAMQNLLGMGTTTLDANILITKNDLKVPFSVIADYIERTLRG